jgi:hypothetical protein
MSHTPWSHRIVAYVDEPMLVALQRFGARSGTESTSQALRLLISRALGVRDVRGRPRHQRALATPRAQPSR